MDTNQRFVRQFVVDLISQSFENMSRAQCEEFVARFFDLNQVRGGLSAVWGCCRGVVGGVCAVVCAVCAFVYRL